MDEPADTLDEREVRINNSKKLNITPISLLLLPIPIYILVPMPIPNYILEALLFEN